MKIILKPSWILTNENATSSYGITVLVHRPSGVAYGPGDIVQAYASWGPMPAAVAVRRMARTAALTEAGRAVVERFALRAGGHHVSTE